MVRAFEMIGDNAPSHSLPQRYSYLGEQEHMARVMLFGHRSGWRLTLMTEIKWPLLEKNISFWILPNCAVGRIKSSVKFPAVDVGCMQKLIFLYN